ncbi:MAG: molecular chaperone HtpG [Bacillariaceae sp.]|jgi:molecular chaperone HtpG
MDLIINSLYSDRDIFLRELISNAADACDKKRFLSITDGEEGDVEAPPAIKIKCDVDTNTVTIEDSGVGMTKDEIINNLGKIAQSGTRAFAQALGDGKSDVNLIGQFGVGFYSAFLVADKVTVVTKSMQDNTKAYKWESEADSSYSISDASPEEIEGTSGTKLILQLKEDASTYLEPSKIEELLQRYSEFIEFPMSVWKEKTDYKQVPDEEANKDLEEGEEPKMKTVPETTEGYEPVNNQKPIWLRSPREVSDDEYQEFYKTAFKSSYDTPMKSTHFVLEGQVECKAILYIPGMLPFELSKDMFDENSRNIRLYVKRVFINDGFQELMPRWLKFVKGVVDSDDLPLNVSREILQKSKVLSIINKRLVRKSLDMIEDIAKDDSDEGAQYIVSFLLFRIGSFGSNVILCYYLPLYIKFGSVAD